MQQCDFGEPEAVDDNVTDFVRPRSRRIRAKFMINPDARRLHMRAVGHAGRGPGLKSLAAVLPLLDEHPMRAVRRNEVFYRSDVMQGIAKRRREEGRGMEDQRSILQTENR